MRKRLRSGALPGERTEYERLRADLVVSHVNVVRYLAGKFLHRGQPLEDLLQVGTVGLIKAVDRYDSERDVEFRTYATPTILGEIKRYFRDRGWTVRVPRRLQELNLAVNRAVHALTGKLNRSPMISELSQHLGVSDEEIVEARESGQLYNALSLDSELENESDGTATLMDFLSREDAQIPGLEDRADIERAFAVLDQRERLVLYLRYYENLSQTRVAVRLELSQMQISRIEHRALERLKSILAYS
ncbi:MAG: SigB/SigF/SigG family RNA polymerase sigma factor [bacterium]|nr:SigB/SigF/SigG family RNA polymerase sigma factor [bacterium]